MGGADVMPIGNLYKTQVYQLAEYLGVPRKIIERTPTTDTYSAEQTQEEFFYQLPFKLMDIYWYGFENGYSPKEVAEVMGETEERVEALFRNFERKRQTTEYLRDGADKRLFWKYGFQGFRVSGFQGFRVSGIHVFSRTSNDFI